jgi:hypothetical protein
VITPPSLPLTGVKPAKSVSTGSTARVSKSIPVATTVQWKDALAGRTSSDQETPAPAPSSADARPALYQVGISPEGIPLHCVQLESSGDPASDEAAHIWIMARRFQPAARESWGRVLVLWGTPSGAPVKPSQQP